MSGELVPLVLLPRYTTYAGAGTYTTIAMDVTEYQSAIVNVWRGILNGGGSTVAISFEESTNQVSWTTCTNGTGGDPGVNTETQYTPTLSKRWFRAKVVTTGSEVVSVMLWAVGFLEMRIS